MAFVIPVMEHWLEQEIALSCTELWFLIVDMVFVRYMIMFFISPVTMALFTLFPVQAIVTKSFIKRFDMYSF